QSITFSEISDRSTNDLPFVIEATASSGLPVVFEITAGPATIDGNLLSLTGDPGIVTVRAYQDGNAEYHPAPDVFQSFNVESPSPGMYCTAIGQEPWQQWISRVRLADIDHESGKDRYGAFTDISTILEAGESYPIELQASFSWAQFDEYFRVWIDWNQDGDFSDAAELVVDQIALAGTPPTPIPPLTELIEVPTSALTGSTRMRVAMQPQTAPEACGAFQLGEVEDYTIVIDPASNAIGNATADLLFLTVQKHQHQVRLNWVSNTAYKTDYFEIERSIDGIQFEFWRKVESVGEQRVPIYHQLFDEQPHLGLSYYRVKAVFEDGSSKITSAEMVIFDWDQSNWSIFPNPAQGEIYLHLPQHQGQSATIQIYNAKGQAMLTQKVGQIPNDPFRIDLNNYHNGIYTMTIQVNQLKRI
ncbi:MAG: GEVED domain-containing protein, partial [Bacteroidota bacterium]